MVASLPIGLNLPQISDLAATQAVLSIFVRPNPPASPNSPLRPTFSPTRPSPATSASNFLMLYAVHTHNHSVRTFSNPRSKNRLPPLILLITANGVSATCSAWLSTDLPCGVCIFAAIFSRNGSYFVPLNCPTTLASRCHSPAPSFLEALPAPLGVLGVIPTVVLVSLLNFSGTYGLLGLSEFGNLGAKCLYERFSLLVADGSACAVTVAMALIACFDLELVDRPFLCDCRTTPSVPWHPSICARNRAWRQRPAPRTSAHDRARRCAFRTRSARLRRTINWHMLPTV